MNKMTISHTNNHAWLADAQWLLSLPLTIARHVALRLKARRELNRLLELPDYLLKDAGLQRHDIESEAFKPLWRE